MSIQRRIGLGCTLAVDVAGGTTFVTVGGIVDGWTGSGAKADIADLSILTDTFKPKGKGQVDPGELTFMIAYSPEDTTSQLMATQLAATGVNPANWQVTLPAVTTNGTTVAAKSFTFLAWLTGMGDETKKDKLITAPITLTKSGNPGYSTS